MNRRRRGGLIGGLMLMTGLVGGWAIYYYRKPPELRLSNMFPKDFRRQDLTGRDFSGQMLAYADLSEANCTSASFQRADLQYANLSGAICTETILSDVNLQHVNFSNVRGHFK